MALWSVLGLVLYFDGALRPPRDPGFPTKSLCRMASCGAAVLSSNGTVIALGGKSLDLVPGITPADVEYEGLLLGLEWLDRNPWHTDHEELIVRGDCKTVIDQLNGESVPRKVQFKHEIAMELLERIRKWATITCEHVPREENVLCDALCAEVMTIVEKREVASFLEELSLLRAQNMNSTPKSALIELLQQRLSSDKSLVRYSIRPELYQEAVAVAEITHDGRALEFIGQQLVSESKLWSSDHNEMKAKGVLLQVRGQQMLGREEQAKRLLHKHRTLLGPTHDVSLSVIMQSTSTVNVKGARSSFYWESSPILKAWYDGAHKHDIQLNDGFWIPA